MNDKDLGGWLDQNLMYLYAVAWGFLRDKSYEPIQSEVDDVVSEALLRIWRSRKTFVPNEKLNNPIKAWVAQITRNACWVILSPRKYGDHLVNTTPVIYDVERAVMIRETVREGLDTLNPDERRAITMQFVGYDYQEIADELGKSWNEVKWLLSNARRRMKRNAHRI